MLKRAMVRRPILDGSSDQLVRTVTENGRTLKFVSHVFETE